jgi:hypothetical protein
VNSLTLRLRHRSRRAVVSLVAAAAVTAGGVAAAATLTPAHRSVSDRVDITAASSAAPACTQHYQPKPGYDMDVCASLNGTMLTPSLTINQVAGGGSCTVTLEVWDSSGNRLDKPASSQPYTCTPGARLTGASLDLSKLTGVTAATSPSGTLTAHVFARVAVDGTSIYTPGQGDSPTVTAPDPSGCQPGDTEAGCKNPAAPATWCPTSDATQPVCSATGAFQNDMPDDYNTITPITGDYAYKNYASEIILPGIGTKGPNAKIFFNHYLDPTGTDLPFDASSPYHASAGFHTAVDAEVHQLSQQATAAGQSAFDSGYLDYTISDSSDWANAVGHGFYRVTGTRDASGSWTVHLQLTSYYQFRPGGDFSITIANQKITLVRGADMRRLEQTGLARNFREIGTATLTYAPDATTAS